MEFEIVQGQKRTQAANVTKIALYNITFRTITNLPIPSLEDTSASAHRHQQYDA